MLIPEPPSGITGPLRGYLQDLAKAINAQPQWSYASLATPESLVTGKVGHFFINVGSVSTLSRVWTKTGPTDGTLSTTSWVLMKIQG